MAAEIAMSSSSVISAAAGSSRTGAASAFRAPHRHFRGRPRKYTVRAEILAAHRQVRTAVAFAQNHSDLRNRCRRVCEQHLRAVADDAAMLLLHSRKESRNVHKRQQRDV